MTLNQLPASPPILPSAPTAVVDTDLDTQIEQLEQRLVAREAWVRSTAESLAQSAKRAVTPRPWVLPVAGVGVVMWLGWRWSHRPDPARLVSVEVPANVAGHDVDGLADLPWAGLTAVGWPLVPEAWRGNLSPAAAATVVSTVLSIGRRLLRRRVR
ncbi:MAG: hypothetical protein Q7J47_16000 [Azoarcus sp.]|nr:hypothetical protein [Azoarcus sp.]